MHPETEQPSQSIPNRDWYQPVNPNAHTYVPGYGFSPRSPEGIERKQILLQSGAVVITLVAYYFLSGVSFDLLLSMAHRLLPLAAYPALGDVCFELAAMVSAIFGLTVPFGILTRYIHIPAEAAYPIPAVPVGTLLPAVFFSLGVSSVAGYASFTLGRLLAYFDWVYVSPDPQIPMGLAGVLFAINATLIPAIFEEIAFRGVLMQSLRRFGDTFALVVSAVLFALAHPIPTQMPNAFLMGLTIGYFTLFTGSLRTGMLIHFCHNALVLLQMVLWQWDASFAGVVGPLLDLLFLLLSLVAAVVMMRNYTTLFALKSSQTVHSSGQKLAIFFGNVPMLLLVAGVFINAARYLA